MALRYNVMVLWHLANTKALVVMQPTIADSSDSCLLALGCMRTHRWDHESLIHNSL